MRAYDYEETAKEDEQIDLADSIHPEVTPRLNTMIMHAHGCFSFKVFPDSGGCTTMIATDLAEKEKMEVNYNAKTPKFVAVNGAELKIDGITTVTVENLSNGIKKPMAIIVSPDMTNDFILGYPQLKELNVISEKFPFASYRIDNTNDFEILKDRICNEYPTTIRDSLPNNAMRGPPMKISLVPDAKPYKILTARPIPRHYQEEATELVNGLLKNQIIARVEGTTDWTAPAFMVPKNKHLKSAKNNLRLVTDLSQLNKYIIRPIHPFPSPQTILSNIPSTSRYFASLDAVSGYHQVPLDEESSYLTTFLLPCGRFRYLRAPMGLCSSSDEWCRRSDTTIENIPRVHKLVDDYLVTRDMLDELSSNIRKVLDKCKDLGLTISRRKFIIGMKIKFAGFELSQQGVKPDEAKMKAISEFPTPKDVTGVRSFLGLANQLAHFIPDLASISTQLDNC